jgi:hypothetical protein
MAKRKVTAIRRDGNDPDRRIDLLQGDDWGPHHIDTVISHIQTGEHTYHVDALFWEAPLEVLPAKSGRLYVRTAPDGLYDDNLYALPEISGRIRAATILGLD